MSERRHTRWWYVAIVAGAILLGALVGFEPRLAMVFVLAGAFCGAYLVWDADSFPFVMLAVLLLVPFDFISGFDSELRALPAVAAGLGGWTLALIGARNPLERVVRDCWDVWLFSAALVVTFAINGLSGGVRQALMLGAGVAFYLWVRLAVTDGEQARRRLLWVLVLVGVGQGAGAILERAVGTATLASVLPGYLPAAKEFTATLGSRAVAFAGHPLRLGTAGMLGCIAGFSLMRIVHGKRRVFVVAATGISVIGLLLSGARGAWLGALVGLIALLALTPGAESHKLAFRVSVGAVVGWFLLSATGVIELISERLFGAASRPASLAQRVGVLSSAVDIWSRRPLEGYGFGTYLEQIYAQGFRYSNTENEYVNFLLSGGLIAFFGWTVLWARAVHHVWFGRAVPLVPALGGLLAAWLLNVGTYNAFSWSAAFPAFMVLIALIAQAYDEQIARA